MAEGGSFFCERYSRCLKSKIMSPAVLIPAAREAPAPKNHMICEARSWNRRRKAGVSSSRRVSAAGAPKRVALSEPCTSKEPGKRTALLLTRRPFKGMATYGSYSDLAQDAGQEQKGNGKALRLGDRSSPRRSRSN
jgi:hypothetical protein